MANVTEVFEFYLCGISMPQNIQPLVFVFLLMMHTTALLGNFLIIIIVLSTSHIHSPMYLFLVHLSLSDFFLSLVIGPKMLQVLLANGSSISFGGCISQLYFFGVIIIFECFLLLSMSYDRYLAICNPLRYQSLMNVTLQIHLTLWPWFLGFTIPLFTTIAVSNLQFCRQHIINHFFCDLAPLVKLSCSDTSVVEMNLLVMSLPIIPVPFILILLTYSSIAVTILRISSVAGRRKAFSTCSSHLIVVCMYYGSLVTLYVIPSGEHLPDLNKILSLVYTVATPMCNPLIYSLRNREIMVSLKKLFS